MIGFIFVDILFGALHFAWYLFLMAIVFIAVTESIDFITSRTSREGIDFFEKKPEYYLYLLIFFVVLAFGFFVGDKNQSIDKQKAIVEEQVVLVEKLEKENGKLTKDLEEAMKSVDEYKEKYADADKELKKLEAEKNEAIQKEEKEKAEALAKAEAKKKEEEQARKAAEEAAVEEPVVYESFKNCTEMRKVYPSGVPSSHPAYEPKHDRDKDGYACD